MDTVRLNASKNPVTKCNPDEAVYFEFFFKTPFETPLEGLHFIAFMSDELGLNTTVTLGAECLTLFFNDIEHNWFCYLTTYAYTRIYEKLCFQISMKTSDSARREFQESAQKFIKTTIHGNKVTLTASSEELSSLKSSLQKQMSPQADPQPLPPQVEPPQVMHPKSLRRQAGRHQSQMERDHHLQRLR